MSEVTNPLDAAEVATMDPRVALTKFREYAAAARRSRRKQDAAMRDVYQALSQGKGVLNITAAIKQGGIDYKTCLPRLAILRADERICWFKRFRNGSGLMGCRQYLCHHLNRSEAAKMRQFDIPEETLMQFQQIPEPHRTQWQPPGYYDIHQAPAPVIPPQHRPPDSLSKYWLLWHVEEWKRVAPVDPMLLLPVGDLGLAIVVAHWDLSPVERMVMGALLGN